MAEKITKRCKMSWGNDRRQWQLQESAKRCKTESGVKELLRDKMTKSLESDAKQPVIERLQTKYVGDMMHVFCCFALLQWSTVCGIYMQKSVAQSAG